MKSFLTFILGLVVGISAVGAYWYTHPKLITFTIVNHVNISDDIQNCKAWGGDYDIGKPVPELDYFLYGHFISKPYKDIGDGWVESCTKSNTTSDSFY